MVPLILSWAITIHKCQGMTLSKAVIELDGFDYGMEYVALSRVKTLSGLGISKINFNRFNNNKFVCKKALDIIQKK